jgi:hypothetical protein
MKLTPTILSKPDYFKRSRGSGFNLARVKAEGVWILIEDKCHSVGEICERYLKGIAWTLSGVPRRRRDRISDAVRKLIEITVFVEGEIIHSQLLRTLVPRVMIAFGRLR